MQWVSVSQDNRLMQDRQHSIDLLKRDKEYLAREVDSLSAQLKRSTDERETLASELSDLKEQRDRLCDKFMLVRFVTVPHPR